MRNSQETWCTVADRKVSFMELLGLTTVGNRQFVWNLRDVSSNRYYSLADGVEFTPARQLLHVCQLRAQIVQRVA